MSYEDWELHQKTSLISEIVAARSLMDYGTAVLRNSLGTFDEMTEPVLTTLAIGIEKLYKLTIGLAALTETGNWPSTRTMIDFRHDLVKMHQIVMRECRSRAAADPALLALVEAIDADPVVVRIIAALSDYGKKGRFYYLDQIGDPKLATAPSPRDFGDAIELTITLSEPKLEEQWNAARESGSEDALSQHIQQRNRRMADSVHRTRHMVAMCWASGAFGEPGSDFRTMLMPMGSSGNASAISPTDPG